MRIANLITCTRFLCSIALLFCPAFSPSFYILYLVVKILLLPVVTVLTLVQWISFVAVCVTSGVFRLLGSVFIGTAIMSCAFGIDPISEMWRMLAIGAVIFLVPEVGEWFILRIATLNHLARHWLIS